MPFNTQEGITVAIAGRDQGVVYSAGSVLDEGEDGAPAIGAKNVTDLWHKCKGMRPGVLHGHELAHVIAIERPSVYHLLSVGINHQDVLPARNLRRLAPSRRYLNRGCIHSATSLGFGSARAADHCNDFDVTQKDTSHFRGVRATILRATNAPHGEGCALWALGFQTELGRARHEL